MTHIGCYQVKVQINALAQDNAFLSPASIDDIPNNWSCNWVNFWKNTNFECQNIVKIVYQDEVWGLVHYGLYPYLYPNSVPPRFLEIEHIEAHPTSRGEIAGRFMEPIGKWLIWYATQVALKFCQAQSDDPLVILEALDTAVSYYRDKVQMEYLGFARSTPGEDLYGFRFSRTAAEAFCQRHESQWGGAIQYEQ
ncbi:hypothetical protein H6G80_04985 [Nostoc sp. FACHB-87]|uniref:hypothetical protein n=1 Tax=Nostocaceae TaxID=1162 RepID=UPI00168475A2|nr:MULTISPECIES: hypothetical protein [Nostocaceae]MBD2301482.1 hypothetical protein [Nostoc sp. FACHB-190]MBD2453426.1 hypothetical protein [Nostoc sp. FACHB-87]MBD2475551.1 hypothetical protein [Anabaena sp. FACHB-83]